MSNKPLNVVIPTWHGDEDQAERLLEWIAEMGIVQAPFHLLCDNTCNVTKLLEIARKAFSKVAWIEDRERVSSNWGEPGDHPKSAAGPNSLFRQCAWHFAIKQLGPWFWCEPDAIWCRKDTYQMIEREYQVGGKLFMGYRVCPQNHPGVPDHMSGVGVYPEQTPSYAPLASNAGEVAFDIAGVTETCTDKGTHFTPILFHKYRAPGFFDQHDFNQRVPEHLACYHSCKDGSIIPFLRKRLGISNNLPAPQPKRVVQLEERPAPDRNVEGSNPVTCDIFIKTRPHDYPWLEWCLKSIRLNCRGFNGLTVINDHGLYPKWHDHKTQGDWIYKEPKEPGYLWQQVCKLHSDKQSQADFILFQDSDTIFTRSVTPSDFIRDGKPIWLYTPLGKARKDQHQWVGVMEKFLGKKPEHEYMRRHPFCVPRWALEEFRTFCKYRHGKSLEDYIMGEADPSNGLALRFSEWNCLGFFLWEYHRDKVHWVLDSEAEEACVFQGHTHSGEARKQEDLRKFREILGSPSGDVGNSVGGEPPTVSVVAPHSTPSLTIQSAIEFIASQVKDNPHKARVIRELKTAWKGKGVRNAKVIPIETVMDRNTGQITNNDLLLCIHSYPGANETMERHWPYFQKAGASRIVGIGTTDGKCTWPDGLDAVVDIGENAYMKMKGRDDHLCRRLLDTIRWCLTQPEDRFAIVEYDVLILRKFPKFTGVHAHLTGGHVNGSKTNQFFHNPWLFDRASGPALVKALEATLPDSQEYPDNSPDLFFGLAVERAKIPVKCCFKLFTRNSLDTHGDLDLAVQAALDGAHAIHGVKESHELQQIERALNERHLSLSHVA